MKLLVFDADKSLASIGGSATVEQKTGLRPIPITQGLQEFSFILGKLFQKKRVKVEHPLMEEPITEERMELTEAGKGIGVEVIAIDTWSELGSQTRELMDAAAKASDSNTKIMSMQDWGAYGSANTRLARRISQLSIPAIVNMHIEEYEDSEGEIRERPLIKGGAKNEMPKWFDCVFYTEVKKGEYLWRTKPNRRRDFAKDRLDVLDELIPQNYKAVLDIYTKNGVPAPKILTLGSTGSGKTRAFSTLF